MIKTITGNQNFIDCVSMWILNILNNKESRTFVDWSGIIGQKLASFCDEVYEIKLGLAQTLKAH